MTFGLVLSCECAGDRRDLPMRLTGSHTVASGTLRAVRHPSRLMGAYSVSQPIG